MQQNSLNTSPADELMQKIKQVFDEYYSQMLSEYIKTGLRTKKESEVKNA